MKQIILLVSIFCFMPFMHAQKDTEPITKIPFELEGNHIFIQLKIEESESLEFVFDTGAGGTVINTTTAEKLGLIASKTSENTGASGKVITKIIKNNQIRIKTIKLDKIDLQSAPLSHLEEKFGRNLDGIIGYDFLKKYVVEINYDDFELVVFKAKNFKYQGDGEMVKIDLGNVPTAVFPIALKEGGYIKEEFILDNGAGLALAFTSPFSKRNNLRSSIGKTYPNNASGFSSNVANVYVGKIHKLKILDYEYANIPASIYNTDVGVFANEVIASVIGNEILKKFNITFDYKRKRSYWELNDRFLNEAFEISHSGLKLKLNSDRSKIIVDYIIPKSEVANSKLKVGDEIIEIDNVKTSNTSLTQLRKLLHQDGKVITIKFKQDHQVQEVTIHLKPLI